jgi:5-methylcytosine-specific restriction endonuclease McrA
MAVKKYSPKRRRIYSNGENIDRMYVFERDNWVCHLCKSVIDSSLRFPHALAATLDHIVPLGAGGTHTLDNVAASHAQCNHLKGCNVKGDK